MIAFWIIVGVALIALGLFVFTQGGQNLGPAISTIGLVILLILLMGKVHAHDSGQWENGDPAVREWYRALMQPDAPTASCCGEADAYWCDKISVRKSKTFCAVTDDRPDAALGRPHVDIGTEIEIPDNKLKWDRGNPTGHAIVFISRQGYVFCFVQPSGI
jgi:hypothetical protein